MMWSVALPMIIFLIAVFIIGLYASRSVQKSGNFLQDYFLGGRQLGGFLLAMTMVTTYASASSFIGGPGIAYQVGLSWVLLAMIQVVTGYFVLTLLGKKFAIMARKMKAVTMIDFLRERYQSKWVVILSALCIIIFLFSSMAAQWVGGGRMIQSVTGLNYLTALIIFAAAVLVYVIIGGFRAVVITDSIQGVVMLLGTVLIIATILAGGGLPHIMATLRHIDPGLITPYGPHHQFSPSYISSFWVLVGIGVVGLPQVAVRAMSYKKNSKAMHQALIIGTIVVGGIMFGMHFTGVLARAVMPNIKVGDQVMPLLAMKVLPHPLAGIVLAAPMAAIMTTVNALLLLVSSSVVKDIYLNYIKPDASDQQQAKGLSMLVTGIIGLLVLFMAVHPPNLLIWLNLFAFGGLEAAFIWPIVLGLYWKKGNAYGALAAIIIGVGSYIVIQTFYGNLLGLHPVVIPVILSLFWLLDSQLNSTCTREVFELPELKETK
ncbi:sodium/pantothenate symporter [Terrilactibacillus sp. S3-3]|nr:sodium/pantothenate symporter [Terrilactibacillus sp. S3-3]